MPLAIVAGSGSALGALTGAQAHVTLSEFSIKVPDGAADAILSPARQPAKHGMGHRAVATLLAPYLVSRPHRHGLDAAIEPGADDLEEKTLDDLSGFVIDDLEIDGSAAIDGDQGVRCCQLDFLPPTVGRAMPEHQPETRRRSRARC